MVSWCVNEWVREREKCSLPQLIFLGEISPDMWYHVLLVYQLRTQKMIALLIRAETIDRKKLPGRSLSKLYLELQSLIKSSDFDFRAVPN